MNIRQHGDRVGSNPGGKVSITLPGQPSEEFYLKYVNGIDHRKISVNAPWDPGKQPVYEVLTLALSKALGLLVPRSYVVKGNDVHNISYTPDIKKPIEPGKPYYFLSQFLTQKGIEDEISLDEIMKREEPYRDILMLGDIVGRGQNYRLIDDGGMPKLVYVDCGCSFVDAKEGKITQRQEVQKLMTEGAKIGKRIRQARRQLEKTGIVSNHHDLHQHTINAAALIDGIPRMHINFYPYGHTQSGKLLSDEELEYVQNLFSLNMAAVIKKHKKRKDIFLQ